MHQPLIKRKGLRVVSLCVMNYLASGSCQRSAKGPVGNVCRLAVSDWHCAFLVSVSVSTVFLSSVAVGRLGSALCGSAARFGGYMFCSFVSVNRFGWVLHDDVPVNSC